MFLLNLGLQFGTSLSIIGLPAIESPYFEFGLPLGSPLPEFSFTPSLLIDFWEFGLPPPLDPDCGFGFGVGFPIRIPDSDSCLVFPIRILGSDFGFELQIR